eukprot:g23149.t1
MIWTRVTSTVASGNTQVCRAILARIFGLLDFNQQGSAHTHTTQNRISGFLVGQCSHHLQYSQFDPIPALENIGKG